MTSQVFILQASDLEQLGQVRAFPGLLAANFEGSIWLRGIPLPPDCPLQLQGLPAMERWRLDEEERLFRQGEKVPSAKLPPLNWQPLAIFLPLEMPLAAYAGRSHSTMEAFLQAAEEEQPVSLLICTLQDLKAWAEQAPRFRLEQLQWAAEKSGSVAIKGTLLPSLPGQAFWHFEGLHLPAGWQLENPILAKHLKSACDPDHSAEVFLLTDGKFEFIPLSNFQPCSRSGIRRLQIPQ